MTPVGAPVLVCYPEKDQWEDPYSILDINGEDVTVLTSIEAQKFQRIVMKPCISFISEMNESISHPVQHDSQQTHFKKRKLHVRRVILTDRDCLSSKK